MSSEVLKAMIQTKDFRLVIMITLPVFAIIILITFSDIMKITQLIGNLEIKTILIIIGVSFIRPILGGWRASFAYRPIGNLSLIDASKGYVLSAYGTIFLPSAIGGDVFRIEHMKNCTEGLRKEAFLVAAVERFMGFLCLFVLAFLISFFIPSFSISVPWIFSIIFIFICSIFTLRIIIKRMGDGSMFSKAIEYIKGYANPYLITGVFGLSFLFQCVSLSVPVIVAYVVADLEIAIMIALMTPAVALFSTIPISVGGLGLREASYVALGALVGIEQEVSFIAGLALSISIIISGLPGVFFQNELIGFQKIQDGE